MNTKKKLVVLFRLMGFSDITCIQHPSSPNSKHIYYTLDGSQPSISSNIYSGLTTIATSNGNRYVNISAVCESVCCCLLTTIHNDDRNSTMIVTSFSEIIPSLKRYRLQCSQQMGLCSLAQCS